MTNRPVIVPVIMSGGAGTRLWPLSTAQKPKQFHALTGALTLLQQTVLRCAQARGFAAPIVVCARRHAQEVERQCTAVNTVPALIITEPCPRNTAPCAVTAAQAVATQHGKDACVLLLAADHYIADTAAFLEKVEAGLKSAQNGHIVTFGARVTGPATGYGYIRKGAALNDQAFAVRAFVEKPDAKTAAAYMRAGDYVWNAGIFLFRADVMRDEMQKFRPDILEAATQAWSAAAKQGPCAHLNEKAFAACPSDSVDYAIMEKTDCAAMLPLDAGWSDVGTWPAIYDLDEKDQDGNACHGRVTALETKDCLFYAQDGENGPQIAALGVDNLIVVSTKEAVLVLPKDRADEIKALLESMANPSP